MNNEIISESLHKTTALWQCRRHFVKLSIGSVLSVFGLFDNSALVLSERLEKQPVVVASPRRRLVRVSFINQYTSYVLHTRKPFITADTFSHSAQSFSCRLLHNISCVCVCVFNKARTLLWENWKNEGYRWEQSDNIDIINQIVV